MNNACTETIPLPLHHTHSNAHPLVASKVNLPVDVLDMAAAVQSHVYAAAWLAGRKNGAVE